MSKDGPIYEKFYITRVDGSSQPGGRHRGCEYWVLDLTCDPAAITAVLAYADAIEKTHPILAADIRLRHGVKGSTDTNIEVSSDGRQSQLVAAFDYIDAVDRYFNEHGWESIALLEARRALMDACPPHVREALRKVTT